MSGRTRWVVLDGSSSAFEYSGRWEPEFDDAAHLSTMWTTTVSGSDMRFRFNGSEMILFGTIKAGRRGKPVVNCSVDGLPSTSDPRATDENFACAWKGGASNTPHDFFLNVTMPGGSASPPPSVSIDSLWFSPSFDSTLSDEKALVIYDHDDPHIDFPSGVWQPLADDDGVAVAATQAGSSMYVSFTGTSLTWEGWRAVGSGFGAARSSGTYSIDGGPPVTFIVEPPGVSDTTSRHGIKLIEVKDLVVGPHNLTVVYNGLSTPLVLDHLYIGGGNFRIEEEFAASTSLSSSPILPLPLTTSSSSSNTPSSSHLESFTPSPSASSSSPPSLSLSSGTFSIAAIAGGVAGGLLFLLVAIFLTFWVRRRRAKTAIAVDQITAVYRASRERRLSHESSIRTYQSPTSAISAPYSAWTSTNFTSHTSAHHDHSNTHEVHLETFQRQGQRSNASYRPPNTASSYQPPNSVSSYRPPNSASSYRPPNSATSTNGGHRPRSSEVRLEWTRPPQTYRAE